MTTKTLGFIGGGRVTKIILQAFQNKRLKFDSVMVHDANPEMLASLQRTFPSILTTDQAAIAAKQEVVFIALHPPVIMEMLEKIREVISEKSIIVSLAPKITIGRIADKLVAIRIARLIPNATSYINEGCNPVCFSGAFGEEKRQVLNLLNLLGDTFEVPEPKLEAYALISAMAPTYFWFQWKTLSELGIKFGMNVTEARETVYHTMMAALNTLFKSKLTFEEVSDLIPVKPIGENEPQIEEIYHGKLTALFDKIKA